MPATSSRIGFILQPTRNVEASDSAIKTRFGSAARDTATDNGSSEPGGAVETFFVSKTDAQAMADERLALLKADRRKFEIDVGGALDFFSTYDFSQQLVAATLIDDEKGVASRAVMIAGIPAIDYESNKTVLMVWG